MNNELDVKEKPQKVNQAKPTSLRSILGGDILLTPFFRKNIGLWLLIIVCLVIYIGNGYGGQAQLIKLSRLEKELTDAKYEALLRQSELMEKSRQSKIEDYIQKGRSRLQAPVEPPFALKKK